MRIVTVIGGRKVTVSSYVENILLRHFEQYQDCLLYTSLYNLVVIDRYRPELGVKFGQPGAIFYCRLVHFHHPDCLLYTSS